MYDSAGDVVIGGTLTTSGGTAAGAGRNAGNIDIATTGTATVVIASNADLTATGSAGAAGDNNGGTGGAVVINTNSQLITLNDTNINTGGGAKPVQELPAMVV